MADLQVRKYRKLPVVIEAVRVTVENANDVARWCNGEQVGLSAGIPTVYIKTLEGVMAATLGDWIIKGVKGEFYPCKDDIFRATYEEPA